MKKLILFCLAVCFLLSSSTAVGQDPIETGPSYRLGSELQLSLPSSPECKRYTPRVAYNPVQREYLVVWDNYWSTTFWDIYARRVTSRGELKSQFTVATGANGDERIRYFPDLVYNTTAGEYLVVYMYDAQGDSPTHWEVWGRRVAWNGAWLGPEFQIFTWPNRAFYNPRVAWNMYRNEYLVVADALDTQSGKWNDVAGRVVLADGSTPYPGHSLSAQDQSLQPHMADVVYNPWVDEYLAVWRQRYSNSDWDIYATRLRGQDGVVIQPPGVFLVDDATSDQTYPVVETNQQDRYLVVWQQILNPSHFDIYGQALDNSGGRINSPFDIFNTNTGISGEYPAIAWSRGQRALAVRRELVWDNQYRIEAVTDWSTPLLYWRPVDIALNTSWNPPSVASGTVEQLIVYARSEGSAEHIFARLYWPVALYLPAIRR